MAWWQYIILLGPVLGFMVWGIGARFISRKVKCKGLWLGVMCNLGIIVINLPLLATPSGQRIRPMLPTLLELVVVLYALFVAMPWSIKDVRNRSTVLVGVAGIFLALLSVVQLFKTRWVIAWLVGFDFAP
jgi:hypothetical protein